MSALGSHTHTIPTLITPSSPPSSQPLSPPPPLFDLLQGCTWGRGGGALDHPTLTAVFPHPHLPHTTCLHCDPSPSPGVLLYRTTVRCLPRATCTGSHPPQVVCEHSARVEWIASTDRRGRSDKRHGDLGVGFKEAAWHGTARTTNQHKDNGTRETCNPPGDSTQNQLWYQRRQRPKNKNKQKNRKLGTTINYPARQNSR